MKLKLFLIYFGIGFIFLPLGLIPFHVASAAVSDSISVIISPENPSPGENTTITLKSYAYDLDTAFISWSENGKKITSGIGQKSISMTAPAAGGTTSVTATLSLPDGTVSLPITIRPSAMVLLWETNDSYVPPFYRGKAMPSSGSQVRIVAMPEIREGSKTVNYSNLAYSWVKDYTNNVDGSGYGKNVFTYVSDYLDPSNNISVTASTTDQKYSAQASINVATVSPSIVFYKNDTALGTLWEQAISNGHQISGDEIIEADPYFISPENLHLPLLSWNWSINGNSVDITSARKNLLPVKTQPGVSGTAIIRLEVDNLYKIFETATKEVSVSF